MFSILKKFCSNPMRLAQQAELREGLLDNYWQEAFFRNFPTTARIKESVFDGNTEFKIRVDPEIHRTVTVIVSEGEVFIGTLVYHLDRGKFAEIVGASDLDLLYKKLMRLAEIDYAARTAPRPCESTPDPVSKSDTTENIIPFPSL